MDPSLYLIKAIVLMDSDGNRILGKYYDDHFAGGVKEQRAFEKTLFQKTHKANGEIIMLDGLTIVYRNSVDLFFYVVGSTSVNELILVTVLNCFYDSCSAILRRNLEKKHLIEYMDSVILVLDEICDSGIIMETDATNVVQRISLREADVPLGEQTVFDVLKLARDQLKSSVFK
jgi:hypothetical protein